MADQAAYEKIEKLLQSEGPMTAPAIRDRIGCADSHVRDSLEWLEKQGRAKRVPNRSPKEWTV